MKLNFEYKVFFFVVYEFKQINLNSVKKSGSVFQQNELKIELRSSTQHKKKRNCGGLCNATDGLVVTMATEIRALKCETPCCCN